MKTKDLYILLFIFFASIKISAQEILDSPGVMSSLSKDSTYTEYYKNGQLSQFISFKNGGVWNIERYEKDGTPIFTGTIKNGNGTLENYLSLNDINVRTKGYYINGKPDGNWQVYWDAKGTKLFRETLYKNGYIISYIDYDKKGLKKAEYTYNEKKLPKSIMFDKNREITNVKSYEKGKLVQETKTEYQLHKRPKTTTISY